MSHDVRFAIRSAAVKHGVSITPTLLLVKIKLGCSLTTPHYSHSQKYIAILFRDGKNTKTGVFLSLWTNTMVLKSTSVSFPVEHRDEVWDWNNIAHICDYLWREWDGRSSSILAVLDLSMALDTINLGILLNWLQELGVGGIVLCWLSIQNQL